MATEFDSGYLVYLQIYQDVIDQGNGLLDYKGFEFNKRTGKNAANVSTKKNIARQVITTFGKTPFVYYAGNTDYKSFDLTGVFLAQYDKHGDKVMTAREYADLFIDMVDQHRPFCVENSQHKKVICDVVITNEVTPLLYDEDTMEYVEITINCTEIAG